MSLFLERNYSSLKCCLLPNIRLNVQPNLFSHSVLTGRLIRDSRATQKIVSDEPLVRSSCLHCHSLQRMVFIADGDSDDSSITTYDYVCCKKPVLGLFGFRVFRYFRIQSTAVQCPESLPSDKEDSNPTLTPTVLE